jgi:hypothetical protein
MNPDYALENRNHPFFRNQSVNDAFYQACAHHCSLCIMNCPSLPFLLHPSPLLAALSSRFRAALCACAQVDPTSLAVSFSPASDPESNSIRYFACGSTSNSIGFNGSVRCDAGRLTPIVRGEETATVANSTLNGTLTGLNLAVGKKYFTIIKACNDAGLCNATATKGVIIGKSQRPVGACFGYDRVVAPYESLECYMY